MSTLDIEGWCKTSPEQASSPLGVFHFYIDGNHHRQLEEAEEQLVKSGGAEVLITPDLSTLELIPPPDCGPLSDCHLRVYLRPDDQRGQFHLVGHRASDGSLVYTNAMMIDMLS